MGLEESQYHLKNLLWTVINPKKGVNQQVGPLIQSFIEMKKEMWSAITVKSLGI